MTSVVTSKQLPTTKEDYSERKAPEDDHTETAQRDHLIRLGGLPSVQRQFKRSGDHGIGSASVPQSRTRACTRLNWASICVLHAFTMQRNVDWPLFNNALKADRCNTSSGGQPLKPLVVLGANAPFQ